MVGFCQRHRAVVKRFRRDIQITRPAYGIESNVSRPKQRRVAKAVKNAPIQIRADIKQPIFAGVEFQFEMKIILRIDLNNRLHVCLLSVAVVSAKGQSDKAFAR